MSYLCGIDYGNQLKGTTVVCMYDENSGKISLRTSEKKKNADHFVKSLLNDLQPKVVFLDAPLSLPMVYTKGFGSAADDFFFREADKSLKAMSPMFLGGLTARAMRLKAEMFPIPFYETYPAAQARKMELQEIGYKDKTTHIKAVVAQIQRSYPMFRLPIEFQNWHEVDAILALIGAYRFILGRHETFGNPVEGLIYL
ncbi:MAG: hypothetical protein NW226_20115 [Microscillaceae bacterium]|nr:hypothetical protein [Microscillaceae bacterium]